MFIKLMNLCHNALFFFTINLDNKFEYAYEWIHERQTSSNYSINQSIMCLINLYYFYLFCIIHHPNKENTPLIKSWRSHGPYPKPIKPFLESKGAKFTSDKCRHMFTSSLFIYPIWSITMAGHITLISNTNWNSSQNGCSLTLKTVTKNWKSPWCSLNSGCPPRIGISLQLNATDFTRLSST